jgi:hypothetical protein
MYLGVPVLPKLASGSPIGSGAGDCAPAPSHTTGRAVCSHPAVGPSRVLPSRRRKPVTSEHSDGWSALCVWPVVRKSRVVTVVVAPRCFVLCFVIVSSPSIGSLSSFGPSLGTPFCSCLPSSLLRSLLTSPHLSTWGHLPGSVPVLSARASGLYRMPSVTLGLRVC